MPGSAVIGMIDAIDRKQRLRIAGDENIRFELADDADDIAAQVEIRHEIAIGAIHEVDRVRVHADNLCRGDLLFVADGA